jgi:YD repeat-containing protein
MTRRVPAQPDGRRLSYTYDGNGNRTSLAQPNGTSTGYGYDALNRLTHLTTTGPTGTIQAYAFTLGPTGNRTRIDETCGTVRQHGYDALYRLTSETVSGVSFVYNRPRPGLGEAPELLQPQKTETVKERMHARFSQAYAGMTVNLIERMGSERDRTVTVLDECCGPDVGDTELGHISRIDYGDVVSDASFALPGAPRPALVNGIGEGLGTIIVHEVFHQLVAGGDQRVERGTYDYDLPLQQAGAFDGSLRFSEAARRALEHQVGGP